MLAMCSWANTHPGGQRPVDVQFERQAQGLLADVRGQVEERFLPVGQLGHTAGVGRGRLGHLGENRVE
jgi:hypothetical protein